MFSTLLNQTKHFKFKPSYEIDSEGLSQYPKLSLHKRNTSFLQPLTLIVPTLQNEMQQNLP